MILQQVSHFGSMRRRTLLRRFVVVWLWVVLALAVTVVEGGTPEDDPSAPDTTTTTTSTQQETQQAQTDPEPQEPQAAEDGKQKTEEIKPKEDDFDVENEDWGFYYDPQNVFCSKFDCYKILGFDYESFGKVKPSKKEITQRYRQLSREWHPDKSKHKHAKSRFVKIARAYEVLTSRERRAEYDYMRYNQEAYFSKYGANVLWSYAPKSDTAAVIVLLLLIANVIAWYAQKHRWQMVADRLIKAAVEDWAPHEGGTPESKHLREDALQLLLEREQQQQEEEDAVEANGGSTTTNGTSAAAPSLSVAVTKASVSNKKKSSKKKADKATGREKKRLEQEALEPIVVELVNQMHDFGGGFHKPTHKDLLVVTLAKLPYKIATGMAWQTKYWMRRLQKLELNDEEREVLTERAVGPLVWSIAAEEERQDMLKRELWVKDNLTDWQLDQEIKNLSAADQKHYLKLKKQGKLDKIE